MPMKHAMLMPRGVSTSAMLREPRRVAVPMKATLMARGVSARVMLHEPRRVAVPMKQVT